MTKQYWTIKEAAEALRVSEKTIRRRIKDGILVAQQIPGKYGAEYRVTVLDDALPLDKSLDTEQNTALAKALDIIKALQEENERLSGQVGFLQAQVIELDSKVRLLSEPKRKRSLLQRLIWWRIAPKS